MVRPKVLERLRLWHASRGLDRIEPMPGLLRSSKKPRLNPIRQQFLIPRTNHLPTLARVHQIKAFLEIIDVNLVRQNFL